MEYIHNTEKFQFRHTVVALGKFDGMHKGHQLIFDKLIEYKKQGYQATVFSFDRPPLNMLTHKDIRVIYTHKEKTRLLSERGIDVYIEHPFTDEFSHLSPEDFVKKVLLEKTGMEVLVVGDDCGFGYKRRGNVELLEKMSKEYNFKLIVIPKLELEGEIVSSTRIRSLLKEGNVMEANRLMETPFFIYGPVVHGNQIGKEVLGIPTANQVPEEHKLLPPNGVYVSRIIYKDQTYYGISNIGTKPTIEGKKHMGVETYIFDFEKNIYHKEICVELLYFKRPEMKFESLDALSQQMHTDAQFGLEYVKKHYGYISNPMK
ncbi:bifunctional riboflavin kinase/FAD synthetase [Anaerostipes sp. MSJ-23]|uniref:bifunctional riboflavin kinase/FAD synthetase n=1 Tax=Anaerostipes sp. MSJ-23 TaxID=2841520 RepID=UPI001C128B37|nr:bifunctional riboflavin kinase/FAD synthetase [Anaerostipes sp. MSJ-23]MBU5459833.1 bifunctional riboflavin kinase/FAD synthetase [Anaerostipes sp. MSJ-23]